MAGPSQRTDYLHAVGVISVPQFSAALGVFRSQQKPVVDQLDPFDSGITFDINDAINLPISDVRLPSV